MHVTSLVSVGLIGLQVIILCLAADFVGGLFHWAEDTIGDVDTPLWGPLFVRPNNDHHENPSAINSVHWLLSNRDILIVTGTLMALVWLTGLMSWQILVFFLFMGFNQQAHRFEHCATVRLPVPVRLLQRIGLLQNARQHWQHHRPPHRKAYCVLTPWLNPVLDRWGFWRRLERLLAPAFRMPRRPDIFSRH